MKVVWGEKAICISYNFLLNIVPRVRQQNHLLICKTLIALGGYFKLYFNFMHSVLQFPVECMNTVKDSGEQYHWMKCKKKSFLMKYGKLFVQRLAQIKIQTDSCREQCWTLQKGENHFLHHNPTDKLTVSLCIIQFAAMCNIHCHFSKSFSVFSFTSVWFSEIHSFDMIRKISEQRNILKYEGNSLAKSQPGISRLDTSARSCASVYPY